MSAFGDEEQTIISQDAGTPLADEESAVNAAGGKFLLLRPS
jgi:hypothetical protein